MAEESCHPRALSWFVRSCIPADPAHHTAVLVPFTAPDVEDPEPEPPIAGLPDELLLDILRPCRELLLHLHASASASSLEAQRGRALTLFPRSKFLAAVVCARIYMAGSSARTASVEEYDPATESWRVVVEAPRRRYGCTGTGAADVFYIAGGVAVSGGGTAGMTAHVCAGSVDALHMGSGARVWARHPVLVMPRHRWTWASP
ncbi:F-box/kelch-repeat protein [Zea mays]|uniref:F-box/kelch-repeat protein n=1 Tax=Zea mays TaxID=4577 RepID=A0A1D6KEL2_MAIZE|nr:F-box/kelch-repeat protein [Zea mays]